MFQRVRKTRVQLNHLVEIEIHGNELMMIYLPDDYGPDGEPRLIAIAAVEAFRTSRRREYRVTITEHCPRNDYHAVRQKCLDFIQRN